MALWRATTKIPARFSSVPSTICSFSRAVQRRRWPPSMMSSNSSFSNKKLYSTKLTMTLVSISRTLLVWQFDLSVEFPVNSTV